MVVHEDKGPRSAHAWEPLEGGIGLVQGFGVTGSAGVLLAVHQGHALVV